MNVNVRHVSGPNAIVQARALQEGTQRNQRARALQERGNYQAAEKLHKEALDIKLAAFGMSHPTTAISYNALGEVYIKLHRLDEAEDHLQKALTIAMQLNPLLDQAGYRENLAVVYEMRGDLDKARATRLEGSQNAMLCAYEKVRTHKLIVPVHTSHIIIFSALTPGLAA